MIRKTTNSLAAGRVQRAGVGQFNRFAQVLRQWQSLRDPWAAHTRSKLEQGSLHLIHWLTAHAAMRRQRTNKIIGGGSSNVENARLARSAHWMQPRSRDLGNGAGAHMWTGAPVRPGAAVHLHIRAVHSQAPTRSLDLGQSPAFTSHLMGLPCHVQVATKQTPPCSRRSRALRRHRKNEVGGAHAYCGAPGGP